MNDDNDNSDVDYEHYSTLIVLNKLSRKCL